MPAIDPVTRLYKDLTAILESLVIKYPNLAEENETVESKAAGDRYLLAYYMRDNYYLYNDYSYEDYLALGFTDDKIILQHMRDRNLLQPISKRDALLKIRRARELREYIDGNNYYRMLYGYPNVEDTDFLYVTDELSEKLNIPTDMPIHEIGDKLGTFFISQLQASGYIKELLEIYPEKKYLNYLGSNRIPISISRNTKSFGILSIKQEDISESTYRTFIKCYEKCRNYFMSVLYIYQYRELIPFYDNFIAMCIFIMTVQQISMEGIRNAMDREFYDEYMVRLLYDTYGLPFYANVDEATQKLICQNLNLLVQNKATDKVFLDIASILGFTEISIYQYYLVKERRFDEHGRPVFKKKIKVNINTGKEEEVYDTDKMYDVHFQKVDIRETNIKESLTDSLKRVDYYDITYYDPLWWEDDALHHEIWDTAYNYMETKYYGVTIPYRMTELLLQSVVLLRLIKEKEPQLLDVGISIPKITQKEVSLPILVVLFLALVSKKLGFDGIITSIPSRLIHILEVTDQVINKENEDNEVLQFNFDAFSPQRIKETIDILRNTLSRREYRIVNGHDVDLRDDGTQDIYGPTKKVDWTLNVEDLDELENYINQLILPDGSKKDKINALNKIYENIECIYYFLSYQMSKADTMEDYDAIKKFYDTAFYSHETAEAYKVIDEDGVERCAETFDEYLYYKDIELWQFVQDVDKDRIYEYVEHIIYKIEEFIPHVNYLYVMNEDTSPLVELLDILLKFFKSYLLDFVQLSSLMIIDWDMENTIRFFDEPCKIYKKEQVEDNFYKSFADMIHKFICRVKVEDQIKFKEYLQCHGHVEIDEETILQMYDELRVFRKRNCVDSLLSFFDATNKIRGHVDVDSSFKITDSISWHYIE